MPIISYQDKIFPTISAIVMHVGLHDMSGSEEDLLCEDRQNDRGGETRAQLQYIICIHNFMYMYFIYRVRQKDLPDLKPL